MEMFKEKLDSVGHGGEELQGSGPCGVAVLSGRIHLIRIPGLSLDFTVFVRKAALML